MIWEDTIFIWQRQAKITRESPCGINDFSYTRWNEHDCCKSN